LAFVGNTKPRISSVDAAIARRLNLVPFRFQPATRDEHLKERLVVEYPAILRWAIDGWLDLQTNGPIRPAVIAAATRNTSTTRTRPRPGWPSGARFGPLHEGRSRRCSPIGKLERSGRRGARNQPEAQGHLEKLPGLRFAHGCGVSPSGASGSKPP